MFCVFRLMRSAVQADWPEIHATRPHDGHQEEASAEVEAGTDDTTRPKL